MGMIQGYVAIASVESVQKDSMLTPLTPKAFYMRSLIINANASPTDEGLTPSR